MIFIIPIIIGVAVSAISLAVADATQEDNKAKVRHHKEIENDLIAKYENLLRQYYELQDKSKHEINELHSVNERDRSIIQAFIDKEQGFKLFCILVRELFLVQDKIFSRPSHQLIKYYLDAVEKTNILLFELNIEPIKISHENLIVSLEKCKQDDSLSSESLVSELSIYFSLIESRRIEIQNESNTDEIICRLIDRIQELPLTEEILECTVNFIINTSFEIRLLLLNSLLLPISAINDLSLHQDDDVRESVASIDLSQKPSDGKEQYAYILERLSKDKSPKVRIAIVSNTSTSLMTLSQLCEDYDYDVQKSVYERLISTLQKDPTIIQIFDLNMLRIILEFIDSQNQILSSIVSHLDYLIRIDKLPNRFLEEIVNVTNEEICNQIIQSIEIPELVLNKLATDKKREIRISVASLDVSKKSPEYQKIYISILDLLSKDTSEKVRMLVANHLYASFTTLMKLCEDSNFDIQKNVYQRLIKMVKEDVSLIELLDFKTLKTMLEFANSQIEDEDIKSSIVQAIIALPFVFLRNALRVSSAETISDEAELEIPIFIASKDSASKNLKPFIENDLPLLMNILSRSVESDMRLS